MHNPANVDIIERLNRMHRATVVPHYYIMRLPDVAIHEPLLGCSRDQAIE